MKITLKLAVFFCLWPVVLCSFKVDLPERIEALSGQCVVIPCTFETEHKYSSELNANAAGIWIKNELLKMDYVFNSAKPANNKIRGEITGDLSLKNCTTIFYNVTEEDQDYYHFRIDSGTLKYSYQKAVTLDVRASPIGPSVKLYKDKEEVKETAIVEGSSVSLLCSAETSCPSKPPILTWSILPFKPNIDVTLSILTFIASSQHNNLTFTCTATYLLENVKKSAKTSLTLHVQYAPKNVRVSASQSGPVMLGSSVSLSCSSDANPAVPNYTWYRENGNQIGREAHLTINKTDTTHSGLYYCRAQNPHGAQNSSLLLDIQYAPRNVCVSASQPGPVMLGSSISLSCSSDANPEVLNYTWYRENGEQIGNEAHLTINKTDTTHSGLYYCRAQNQHGTQNSFLLLDIQYAPRNVYVSASQSGPVMLGSSVSLSCSGDANPKVLNYTWYRENGEQIGSEAHLTINKTDTTHSGLYYCRAQNQHGAQNSSLLLDIQYVPRFSLSSSCNSSNGEIVCFCEANGSPSPKLEWIMHGQVILPSSRDPSITEVTVGKTGIRSCLTIHQSLTGTSSLQCVGRNKLGTSKQLFFFVQFPTSGLHVPSLLIGAAIGASAIMILCLIYLCKRRTQHKPLSSAEDNTAGLVSNEEEDDSGYTNNTILSPNQELSQRIPDSLHYTTIDFLNGAGDSGQIIGLSSLTSDYATIQYHTRAENSCTAGVGQKKRPELNKKREKTLQLTEEEATYSNIVRHHTVPAQPDTDEEVKQVRARPNHTRRDE